jgi:hypothetical protein
LAGTLASCSSEPKVSVVEKTDSVSIKENEKAQLRRFVKAKELVLLSEKSEIGRIVGVHKLAHFVKKSKGIVMDELSATRDSGEVFVEYTLYRDRLPAVKVWSEGTLQKASMDKLQERLKRESVYYTQEDSFSYQILFDVN